MALISEEEEEQEKTVQRKCVNLSKKPLNVYNDVLRVDILASDIINKRLISYVQAVLLYPLPPSINILLEKLELDDPVSKPQRTKCDCYV